MSDNQQPSSARAMANSAAGAVREGVAQVTGNPYDQAAADKKKGIFPPEFIINLQMPLNLNGMLPMPLPRLDQRQSHPVEPISTIKIVVKANGRRPSDQPRNLSEV
jgi:hypothetical protein